MYVSSVYARHCCFNGECSGEKLFENIIFCAIPFGDASVTQITQSADYKTGYQFTFIKVQLSQHELVPV